MSFLSPMSGTFQASGTINPSVFVTLSGDHTVAQSVSGDSQIVGVSQDGSKYATVTYAALSGDPIGVYGDGTECWLTLGGSVTAPAWLKPDNNGNGIATTTTTDHVAAQALESGVSGSLVRVRVIVNTLG